MRKSDVEERSDVTKNRLKSVFRVLQHTQQERLKGSFAPTAYGDPPEKSQITEVTKHSLSQPATLDAVMTRLLQLSSGACWVSVLRCLQESLQKESLTGFWCELMGWGNFLSMEIVAHCGHPTYCNNFHWGPLTHLKKLTFLIRYHFFNLPLDCSQDRTL